MNIDRSDCELHGWLPGAMTNATCNLQATLNSSKRVDEEREPLQARVMLNATRMKQSIEELRAFARDAVVPGCPKGGYVLLYRHDLMFHKEMRPRETKPPVPGFSGLDFSLWSCWHGRAGPQDMWAANASVRVLELQPLLEVRLCAQPAQSFVCLLSTCIRALSSRLCPVRGH
jgi:hypothetical protein